MSIESQWWGWVPVDVATPGYKRFTIASVNVTPDAAPARPGEPDTSQLLAAEQLGLFTYSHGAYGDSVKGHAA